MKKSFKKLTGKLVGKNRRIALHPLFVITIFAYLILGKFFVAIFSFLTVILHELAHSFMARIFGYQTGQILLMPYGASLKFSDEIPKNVMPYVALAGPLFNILIAVILICFWWIIPSSYSYTLDVVKINISVGFFNLIPVFPLDGSRVLMCIINDQNKAFKFFKWGGAVIGLGLFGVGIATIFFEFNLSFIVMGIFLCIGALSGIRRERFTSMANKRSFEKKLSEGVEVKTVFIDKNITLSKLVRMLSSSKYLQFNVVEDSNMTIVSSFSEPQLEEFCLNYPLKTPIGNIINIET